MPFVCIVFINQNVLFKDIEKLALKMGFDPPNFRPKYICLKGSSKAPVLGSAGSLTL